MTVNDIEQMSASLLPVVSGLADFEARALFYAMGQQMCIQSASPSLPPLT